MLVNSYEFFVFFVAVFSIYWLLPKRWKAVFLLGTSYLFYGLWEPRFLLLLAWVTGVDYSIGLALDRSRSWSEHIESGPTGSEPTKSEPARSGPSGAADGRSQPQSSHSAWRKRLLQLSLVSNLGILGCFKYFNFFADSLTALFAGLGWQVNPVTLQLLLPIGISFYSFKTLGYVIDVYRGKQAAETNWVHYALFLAFFPALLAGPIDRAKQFLPQLKQLNPLTLSRFGSGLALILLGLFKKVAIADGVAPSVSAVYQGSGNPSWLDIVVATALYAVQIYGDFSGYTDMARGVAKLLGFDLAVNFNLPYFSQNPSEFWRRWHISLSTWLRDYLYISLGGNRRGNLRTYFNLMATMVLGGLWHGATWNFALWGAYQGGILCVHRWFSLVKAKTHGSATGSASDRPAFSSLWKIPLFFGVTCYGWLLFGVTDFSRILEFSRILLTEFGDFSLSLPLPRLAALLGIGLLFSYEVLEYFSQIPNLYRKLWPIGQGLFYAALIFIVLMGSSNEPAQFIYTQF